MGRSITRREGFRESPAGKSKKHSSVVRTHIARYVRGVPSNSQGMRVHKPCANFFGHFRANTAPAENVRHSRPKTQPPRIAVCRKSRKLASAMSTLLVRNGTILDPSRNFQGQADLLVENGKIKAIAPGLPAQADRVIDAAGCYVTPGLIDIHGNETGTQIVGMRRGNETGTQIVGPFVASSRRCVRSEFWRDFV